MLTTDPGSRALSLPDPASIPLYPLTFEPLYQPRVWGGRELERRFGRCLPEGSIGEAWELVDRPEAISRVAEGPLQGIDLHTLWTRHAELFGPWTGPRPGRFPLLLKLLDCAEILSVQVHPGEAAAARLGGEPKAELWVFVATAPGAEIYVGLKAGTTRSDFEAALARGGREVVPLLHRLEPRVGDVMAVPPGRLHAIGAGNLVCEIQQNSDTTYRVYDWDRRGLDGNPRPLHVDASLQSINFLDHEPGFLPPSSRVLADGPWFRVERHHLDQAVPFGAPDRFTVGVILEGAVRIDWKDGGGGSPGRDGRDGRDGWDGRGERDGRGEGTADGMRLEAGRSFLLPAGLTDVTLTPLKGGATVLEVSR